MVTHQLTTACTRPASGWLSSTLNGRAGDAGRYAAVSTRETFLKGVIKE
jgi:hypothetical protein